MPFSIFPIFFGNFSSSQLTNSIIFQRGGLSTNRINHFHFWMVYGCFTTVIDVNPQSGGFHHQFPLVLQPSSRMSKGGIRAALQRTKLRSVEAEALRLKTRSAARGSGGSGGSGGLGPGRSRFPWEKWVFSLGKMEVFLGRTGVFMVCTWQNGENMVKNAGFSPIF